MEVSFLGTGLLGSNFTRALLKKGHRVRVWNRSAERARNLEQYGAQAFASAAEAVQGAELVHLTLRDDQSVDEVLRLAAGGLRQGTTIIDHTTTSVEGAKKRTAYWKEQGLEYMHVPVFMGPASALEGTGTMLVSGDQQLIGRVEPYLSTLTGKVWNLGDEPGKAAAIKLLGNLFHIALTGSVADLLTLARALNVAEQELPALIELMNPSTVAQARLRKIASRSFDEPSWELVMSRKDAGLMTSQAAETGRNLPVVEAVAAKMDAWISAGHGRKDWTVIGSADHPA